MAAQPPRQPPNNLLFRGPPPTLPHVVLLPSDVVFNNESVTPVSNIISQTNDADDLQEINNVGVPTYENILKDQIENAELNNNYDVFCPIPPENYLRRTHSFDISDIYSANILTEIDIRAFRHRRSEPDLSKYGLFVEPVVTMDCGPVQPPLVLNNPFYDSSYVLDPSQLNQSLVVLPENYLAFEDSFVPAWNMKPEYLNDRGVNSESFYEELPLIPSNDPWSVYCHNDAAYEYYSPHIDVPGRESDLVNYMPLTDLDFALPQYMNLPVVDDTNINKYTDPSQQFEDVTPCGDELNVNKETIKGNPPLDDCNLSTVVSSVGNIDEKIVVDTSKNRGSSTQSEESMNADISNDITSSLAFVPSSKSSQKPEGIDDTSDDTCSTDYQEASALDLVQSLEELSCCDSIDFSQSREDISPVAPDKSNTILVNNISSGKNGNATLDTTSMELKSCVALNQVPSIPVPNQLSVKLTPVVNDFSEKDLTNSNTEHKTERSATTKQVIDVPETEITQTGQSVMCNNNQSSMECCFTDNSNKYNNIVKISRPAPQPPEVPPSWLKPKSTGVNNLNLGSLPQICIQNMKHLPAVDPQPQPSCSFTQPTLATLPNNVSQLKPEKQSKEVEVSQK